MLEVEKDVEYPRQSPTSKTCPLCLGLCSCYLNYLLNCFTVPLFSASEMKGPGTTELCHTKSLTGTSTSVHNAGVVDALQTWNSNGVERVTVRIYQDVGVPECIKGFLSDSS
jgi:hypothetical protein